MSAAGEDRTTGRRLEMLLRYLAAHIPPPAAGRAAVILLDGRAAAGKTTLAAALAQALGAGVIHMDDFYLPAALRTPQRYAEPGGNVHYERFAAEVLPHLRGTQAFAYRRFDCTAMALGPAVQVPAGSWRIVEGCYACHPALGGYGDARIFCDVTPDEQRRRIEARGGPEAVRAFAQRWIPLEEAYFSAFEVAQKADLRL